MKSFALPLRNCSACHGSGKELDSPKAGQILREHREQAGLSLRTLAAELDLNFAYLGELETGKKPLSIDHINKITQAIKKLCKRS